MEEERENLEKRHKSGLSWLATIAVLSVLNIVILLMKLNIVFPVGLGTSTAAAALLVMNPEENAVIVRFIGIVLMLVSLLIIAILVFCRIKAKAGKAWAYILGMVIYGLDALLCLWAKDWISLGFHAWGFLGIGMGYAALKKLKGMMAPEAISPATAAAPTAPDSGASGS